jgi:hypothetical protein
MSKKSPLKKIVLLNLEEVDFKDPKKKIKR